MCHLLSTTFSYFSEATFNTFLEFVINKQGDAHDNVDELEKSFKLFDIGKQVLTTPRL